MYCESCSVFHMSLDSSVYFMANLSTSTRISSLTLYIVNKSIDTTEERENLTHCKNQIPWIQC
jgi:hypothetical protein